MEHLCKKCLERDFCKGELPCRRMNAYSRWKVKCAEIRAHTKEVMERAKRKKQEEEKAGKEE